MTPTLNRQERHPALYKTFCAQTLPDKRLYVLDESEGVSPFFRALRDPRVVYEHRKALPRIDGVTRIGAVRNAINGLVREDVILHLDDDDVLDPAYGQAMIERLGDAALCKLTRWRLLHELTGILFEWATREIGGTHYVVRGAQIERIEIDPSEPGADIAEDAFGWSLCYPRSTWERFKFPDEGTEDIPWVKAVRAAGLPVAFVDDLPHLALHTVHVDPNHLHGGSAHFPQRMLGAAGAPKLLQDIRRRMLGAMGAMQELPEGQAISIEPGRRYSILASVRKKHSLRDLAVRGQQYGTQIESAVDDVPPSEYGVAAPPAGYRLVHVTASASKPAVLPWKAPSFLAPLGEASHVVRAWVDVPVGAGASPEAAMMPLHPEAGDIAIIPGRTYTGSALVKNNHSLDALRSILSSYGMTLDEAQERDAGRAGYRFVVFRGSAGPDAGGMLPWKLPKMLSWIDDTHLISLSMSFPVGAGRAETFPAVPSGYRVERVTNRLEDVPQGLHAKVIGAGRAWVGDGVHVVQSRQTGRLAVARWVGSGDASSDCMLTGTSTSATAFNAMPSETRCQLTSVTTLAQDTSGAVSLASTIASGGVPTDAQIITGLGSVATLVGGPAVGLAFAGIGASVVGFSDILQGLFQALGLYNQSSSFEYCGLQQVSAQKPANPVDPLWIAVTTYPQFGAAVLGEKWGPDPPSYPTYSPTYANDPTATFDQMVTQGPANLGVLIRSLMSVQDQWSWDNSTTSNGVRTPATYDAATAEAGGAAGSIYSAIYTPLTPFERYFVTLLLQDLQFWVNCLPFVPPQALLSACVTVWNQQNKATLGTVTYSPSTSYDPTQPKSGTNSIVSVYLSGLGDSTGANRDAVPVTVNVPEVFLKPSRGAIVSTGATALKPTAATPSRPLSAGSKALAGVGAVVAVGVGGAVTLAVAQGQPWNAHLLAAVAKVRGL